MAFAMPWSRSNSRAPPKARALRPLSKITMASPTETAENQNRTGRMGEYHSGCSLVGMIR